MNPSEPLRNPRHEAFARAVATGECSGAEAYRRHVSGGKCSARTAEVTSSTMLKEGSKVALRVAALRAAAAVVAENEFGLTRTVWLARFLALADKAEEAGDYSAARGCLREIGQAMPQWYEPPAEERKITVVIRKAWGKQ